MSTKYYQFILTQAICSPIGAGMVLYPCLACVITWFQKRRALAMGIVTSGSSLGGIVLPILVDHLVPTIGFGWTMRTCGFLMMGLLVVTNVTVRSRLPPRLRETGIMGFVRPFTDLSFLLTACASFFFAMGSFIPITFIVSYGEHIGMSPKLAGYLVSISCATRYFDNPILSVNTSLV